MSPRVLLQPDDFKEVPMRRYSDQEMTAMKEKLYSDLAAGTIDIRDATRNMRKIIGMTQAEYARKVVKISPRILSDFERGVGNPTLDTLERIGRPFGLKVSFLPPEAWRLGRVDPADASFNMAVFDAD